MKKLLVIIITCVTLFSCSKEPNTDPGTDATGSIQYKVNGSLVVMDNVDFQTGQYVIFAKQLKGSQVPDTRYLLNAQKGVNNLLIFVIVTDSLHQTAYHYDSMNVRLTSAAYSITTSFNGQHSVLFYNGDYLDINISSYKGSRITGTFTAKFSPLFDYEQRGSINITEGVMNNIPVSY